VSEYFTNGTSAQYNIGGKKQQWEKHTKHIHKHITHRIISVWR